MGGLLIRKYDGDFWNVVGFPAASFFKLIELLIEEEDDFLDV
jgi:septum formation protein